MAFVSDQCALLFWESAAHLPAMERGRLLTALVEPERDPSEIDGRPVGARNALALRVHAATFGDLIELDVDCPQCMARLALKIPIADLLSVHRAHPDEICIEERGRVFRARVPTDGDVRAAVTAGTGANGVMSCCAVAPPIDEWSASVRRLAEERMAEADPLAVIRFTMACPDCRHRWQCPIDAVDVVHERMAERARALLKDVHRLATAYGWSEADILAMAPDRRRCYLELLGA